MTVLQAGRLRYAMQPSGGAMDIPRVLSACAAVLVAAATPTALAQDYPTQQIRLIVPFPAGGGTDITARLLGEELAKSFGKPIVVDNRPGASGMIGTEAAAKAKAD